MQTMQHPSTITPRPEAGHHSLTTISRIAAQLADCQYQAHVRGDLTATGHLEALVQLYWRCRATVAPATRSMPYDAAPVDSLLAQLPADARSEIEAAMTADGAGRLLHG